MSEGMELPNQEKIRILREKVTYQYLGILEADTIKRLGERENYTKPNYIAEISPKG